MSYQICSTEARYNTKAVYTYMNSKFNNHRGIGNIKLLSRELKMQTKLKHLTITSTVVLQEKPQQTFQPSQTDQTWTNILAQLTYKNSKPKLNSSLYT